MLYLYLSSIHKLYNCFMACLHVAAAKLGFASRKIRRHSRWCTSPPAKNPLVSPSPRCTNKAGDFSFFPQQLSTLPRFLHCINDGVDVEFVIHKAGGKCAPKKKRNGVDQEVHRVLQDPVCAIPFKSTEKGGIKKQKTRRLLEINLTPFVCTPPFLLFESTSFLHGI